MNFQHFQNPMVMQQQQQQLTVQQLQQQLQLQQQQQQGSTAGQVTLIAGNNQQVSANGQSIQMQAAQPHLVTQLQPHQLSQQQLQQLQMQVAVGNIPQHQQQQITQLQQLHMPPQSAQQQQQQQQQVIQQIQPQNQQQFVTGISSNMGQPQQQQVHHHQQQKSQKDKNKPKNPMSAYACFIQVIREEHRRKHPNEHVDFSEFSKKCAEKWRSMTENEKKRFEDMAQADKLRFNREMSQYVPPDGMRIKKRKATKDPSKPKRAWSAFFFFCDEFRPAIRETHPEWRVGDIAKELGKRWENCTDKSMYELKAQEARQRYEDEMVQYRAGTFVKNVPQQPVVSGAGAVVSSFNHMMDGQSVIVTQQPQQQVTSLNIGNAQILQQHQHQQMVIQHINQSNSQQTQPQQIVANASVAGGGVSLSSAPNNNNQIQQQQMMQAAMQQQRIIQQNRNGVSISTSNQTVVSPSSSSSNHNMKPTIDHQQLQQQLSNQDSLM